MKTEENQEVIDETVEDEEEVVKNSKELVNDNEKKTKDDEVTSLDEEDIKLLADGLDNKEREKRKEKTFLYKMNRVMLNGEEEGLTFTILLKYAFFNAIFVGTLLSMILAITYGVDKSQKKSDFDFISRLPQEQRDIHVTQVPMGMKKYFVGTENLLDYVNGDVNIITGTNTIRSFAEDKNKSIILTPQIDLTEKPKVTGTLLEVAESNYSIYQDRFLSMILKTAIIIILLVFQLLIAVGVILQVTPKLFPGRNRMISIFFPEAEEGYEQKRMDKHKEFEKAFEKYRKIDKDNDKNKETAQSGEEK